MKQQENPYNPETEPASYKWWNEKPVKEPVPPQPATVEEAAELELLMYVDQIRNNTYDLGMSTNKRKSWFKSYLKNLHKNGIYLTKDNYAQQPEPMGGKTADELLDDYGVYIHGSMRWRALDAMEAYRSPPQWRETAKELPETGTDILLYNEKYGTVAGWVYNQSFVRLQMEDGLTPLGCFTHWQPLPEKPTTK